MGKTPQLKAPLAPAKESPRKGTPLAPCGKAGPVPAQTQLGKKEEDSESSSEDSDSDGETPMAVSAAQVRPDEPPRPHPPLLSGCGLRAPMGKAEVKAANLVPLLSMDSCTPCLPRQNLLHNTPNSRPYQ